MTLFPSVYSGRVLDVSPETHADLCHWFAEVDLSAEYRAADSWLATMPPKRWPKNKRRFLVNWMRRARKNYQDPAIAAELRVGGVR